jgi:hypothetical protein
MRYEWIELDTVLAIHDFQIGEHGGTTGNINIGMIESAINNPKNLMS